MIMLKPAIARGLSFFSVVFVFILGEESYGGVTRD